MARQLNDSEKRLLEYIKGDETYDTFWQRVLQAGGQRDLGALHQLRREGFLRIWREGEPGSKVTMIGRTK